MFGCPFPWRSERSCNSAQSCVKRRITRRLFQSSAVPCLYRLKESQRSAWQWQGQQTISVFQCQGGEDSWKEKNGPNSTMLERIQSVWTWFGQEICLALCLFLENKRGKRIVKSKHEICFLRGKNLGWFQFPDVFSASMHGLQLHAQDVVRRTTAFPVSTYPSSTLGHKAIHCAWKSLTRISSASRVRWRWGWAGWRQRWRRWQCSACHWAEGPAARRLCRLWTNPSSPGNSFESWLLWLQRKWN